MRNLCSVLALAATLSLSSLPRFADDEPAKDARPTRKKGRDSQTRQARAEAGRDRRQGHGRRQAHRLQGRRRHAHPRKATRRATAPRACSTSPTSRRSRRRAAPGHVHLQRRPGLGDRVAAHGRVRAEARRHRRRSAHAGGAVRARQQRVQPARRQRPRVHRRAGHRLQPTLRRQGQATEGSSTASTATRTRSPSSSAVPVQVRPLELAEVPVRRELRHDALGGARQHARERQAIDLNGVILLSQILNFDMQHRLRRSSTPASTCPTQLVLPTYAATAWYHKKLPNQPADLDAVPAPRSSSSR